MVIQHMFYEKLCKDSNLLENSDNPIRQDFLNRIFLFGTNYNYGFTDIWDSEIYVKNPLIAYGNTYAYGAYLVRNKGGFELLKDIAQNEFINAAYSGDLPYHSRSYGFAFTNIGSPPIFPTSMVVPFLGVPRMSPIYFQLSPLS